MNGFHPHSPGEVGQPCMAGAGLSPLAKQKSEVPLARGGSVLGRDRGINPL